MDFNIDPFNTGDLATVPAMDTATQYQMLDNSYGYSMPGDLNDAAHMAPYVSNPANGASVGYWEGLIGYGITRAIDNRLGPVPIQGNMTPGSFAGQNGRSYSQNTQGRTVQQAAPQSGGLGLLLGLGALAFAFVG